LAQIIHFNDSIKVLSNMSSEKLSKRTGIPMDKIDIFREYLTQLYCHETRFIQNADDCKHFNKKYGCQCWKEKQNDTI